MKLSFTVPASVRTWFPHSFAGLSKRAHSKTCKTKEKRIERLTLSSTDPSFLSSSSTGPAPSVSRSNAPLSSPCEDAPFVSSIMLSISPHCTSLISPSVQLSRTNPSISRFIPVLSRNGTLSSRNNPPWGWAKLSSGEQPVELPARVVSNSSEA